VLGPGEEYLASFSVHPKDGRSGIPSDSRKFEAGTGRTAAAAGRCSRLPLLFLERQEFAPGRGRNRRADACSGVQKVRGEERSRSPVSAHLGHPPPGAGRHVRAGSRHPGEQPGGGPEALREVVQGPSGEHRPPHDSPPSDRGRYKPSPTPVKRKNGTRKLMKTRNKIWCG